jgi:hypothetical protein
MSNLRLRGIQLLGLLICLALISSTSAFSSPVLQGPGGKTIVLHRGFSGKNNGPVTSQGFGGGQGGLGTADTCSGSCDCDTCSCYGTLDCCSAGCDACWAYRDGRGYCLI